jgi:hypothetical protein
MLRALFRPNLVVVVGTPAGLHHSLRQRTADSQFKVDIGSRQTLSDNSAFR